MCHSFRWPLLVCLLALAMISSCHRFQHTFAAVSAICGEPPLASPQDYLALRAVFEKEAVSSSELNADLIAADAKRQPLVLTEKGCVYVPRAAVGVVMFSDRRRVLSSERGFARDKVRLRCLRSIKGLLFGLEKILSILLTAANCALLERQPKVRI